MPKVVSSAGLQEFVSTGKPTEDIERAQPKATYANPNKRTIEKAAEQVAPEPPPEVKAQKADDAPEMDPEKDADWEKYAHLPMPERIKKIVGKKHFEMMSAKEEAAELERLAEQQYNRAMQAEQRQRDLEAQLQAAQPPKAAEPEVKAPNKDDPKYRNDKGEFDWVQFSKDTADFSSDQAVRKYKQEQEAQQREAAAAQAKIAYEARIAEARQIHKDYDKVVPTADIHTHRAVLDYVFFDSKVPGQIAYHLAKNPEFLRQINSMTPTAAVAEIGALAKTFEKPAKGEAPAEPPKRSSGAPPPITPLDTSSSGTVNVDPSKMTFQELRRFERQRAQRR
jgi:hypothetical protein